MGGKECALLHFAPVHTNSYGRMFIEGALRHGALRPDMLNTLCLRLALRSLSVACRALAPDEARNMRAQCQELLKRAEPHVDVRVVDRKPRRWPHHGTGGYVALPESKLVSEDSATPHNPLADVAPENARLLSVFDWVETTVDSAVFGPLVTRQSIRYVRVTFCGFVCPERLLLDQCERRLVSTLPLSPLLYSGDKADYEAHLQRRAPNPRVVYLIPRVDVAYDPMTAVGKHSAIDEFALPVAKHGERSSGVCDVVDYASDRWDGSDTDIGGDYEPDYALGDNVVPDDDVHSENTNGTSHSDEDHDGDDVIAIETPERDKAVAGVQHTGGDQTIPAAVGAGETNDRRPVVNETREERRKRRKETTTQRSQRVQRKVEVVKQTFGGARRDVGLALPPGVADVRESSENKRHEVFWDKSVDARELLKHLERWMMCVAGMARSRKVVMTRLLQTIDATQTDHPFLDMMVQAVLCLAVCEDDALATMFINTYGDLVQCQVSGVVKMSRQREIMQRYKCIEYEARASLKPASLWHVRVRNAVVAQVGEIVTQYNKHMRDRGGLTQESFLRNTVGATRDYFKTEAQAVRGPLSTSTGVARGAIEARGIPDAVGVGRKRGHGDQNHKMASNKKR